jgi:hypothetical protein
MNRADFQNLAELRVKEAQALLNQKYFDGAYYLFGYAVECAFKACIAKQTKQFEFPPNRKTIEAYYQHDPTTLLKASGLELKFREEIEINPGLENSWNIVKAWSEQARYQVGKSEAQANDFCLAVAGSEGVVTWLKKLW